MRTFSECYAAGWSGIAYSTCKCLYHDRHRTLFRNAANYQIGPCVTSVCAPTADNAAANGCAPGAEVTNACGLDTALGENCGTVTCNTVNGNCDKTDVENGAQCSGCDVCEDNKCISASPVHIDRYPHDFV